MKKIVCLLVILFMLFSHVDLVEAYEGPSYKLAGTYEKITCGEMEIPKVAATLTRTVIIILQVATPIVIIILGMVDLLKAVSSQKEDDIKKGQQTFLRRLILGVLVFLAFFIVEGIIGLVAPKDENGSMWNCVDCFVNGDC